MIGKPEIAFADSVDGGRTDIWRYANFFEPGVEPRFRLSLGEGWTPVLEAPEIARELGLERLAFKREDLNPTGSHKARALAYQVSKASQEGKRALLISSSGNAAVAAAAYATLAGITLFAFVSPRTNPVKLAEMGRLGATIVVTERAINLAKYAARRFSIENLRPSVNDGSIVGFRSLGFELHETVGEVDAVFTFVSSGSSLLGIAEAYQALAGMGVATSPALYAVHAGALSAGSPAVLVAARSTSLAGGLGVKRTRRAGAVVGAVFRTGGAAMLTTDERIKEAAEQLRRRAVLTSAEGVASFAALREAASTGAFKSAVCILTGHSSQWPEEARIETTAVDDEKELDRLMEGVLEDSGLGR